MRKVFFVDFDDTLIEKQENPTDFRLPEELIQVAEKSLLSINIFIIVTGRSIGQIDSFFSPIELNVVGCHGSLMRLEGRQLELTPPIPGPLLAELECISHKNERLYENKQYSFTIHGADTRIQSLVADMISCKSDRHQIKLFGSCIEIVPNDTNKGNAIKNILPMLADPSKGAVLFTYIGDDAQTDFSLSSLAIDGVSLIPVTGVGVQGMDHFSSPSAVRKFLFNEFTLSEQN